MYGNKDDGRTFRIYKPLTKLASTDVPVYTLHPSVPPIVLEVEAVVSVLISSPSHSYLLHRQENGNRIENPTVVETCSFSDQLLTQIEMTLKLFDAGHPFPRHEEGWQTLVQKSRGPRPLFDF